MSLSITFLGHAGFLLKSGDHAVAIDPFLTDNPVATIKPDQVKCSHIALTHGHADHFGDTLSIANANDATVIAAYEICEYLGSQGHQKCEPMNPGGRIDTPFGWAALTQAFHSSSYQGAYTGMPCGLLLHIGGHTIYHTGDTALFSDMKLIGEIYQPEIAMICAGDRFTMGPELAAYAAKFIGAKTAIPIHYATWPLLAGEADVRKKFTPSGIDVKFMQPGETWEV